MIRLNDPTIGGGSLERTEAVRRLHVVLQGKDGIGKTVVALLLSQCIEETGRPVVPVDADAVHASLSRLAATRPQRLPLVAGDTIDTRALDRLVDKLLPEEADIVMDTGAAGFVSLGRHLVGNDTAAGMSEAGHNVVVHVAVTGGPDMLDTMRGLDSVARNFAPRIRIVVWLNEYFGPIVNASGKPFEELPVYADNRERIFALVRLPMLSEQASADLHMMFEGRLTFARALARDNTNVLSVQKSRLFRIRQALWPQIARVL